MVCHKIFLLISIIVQLRVYWLIVCLCGFSCCKIIGSTLPSIASVFISRRLCRSQCVIKDQWHPAHHLFQLLPSGRRYRLISARRSRFAKWTLTVRTFLWATGSWSVGNYSSHHALCDILGVLCFMFYVMCYLYCDLMGAPWYSISIPINNQAVHAEKGWKQQRYWSVGGRKITRISAEGFCCWRRGDDLRGLHISAALMEPCSFSSYISIQENNHLLLSKWGKKIQELQTVFKLKCESNVPSLSPAAAAQVPPPPSGDTLWRQCFWEGFPSLNGSPLRTSLQWNTDSLIQSPTGQTGFLKFLLEPTYPAMRCCNLIGEVKALKFEGHSLCLCCKELDE